MTVIAAVHLKDRIALAADNQFTTSSGIRLMGGVDIVENKIINVSPNVYIAGCGWEMYDNLLYDRLNSESKKKVDLSNSQAIFRFFQDIYKDAKKRFSFVNDQCNKEDDNSPFADLDSEFLIVNRNGIFLVSDDISTLTFKKFWSIGSGQELALGYLHHAYNHKDGTAKQLAVEACKTARALDESCGGRIDVVEIKLKK